VEEIKQHPINEEELIDLDPIGIESKIKELEHEEFILMQEVYPIRHEIAQLKHDLSIARAKYWKNK
jgi:hypothetical protein